MHWPLPSAFVIVLVRGLHHGGRTSTFDRRSSSMITVALQKQRLTLGRFPAQHLAHEDASAIGLTRERHTYYGPLRLGSQGQVMTVVFDTGSANLVIPSIGCESVGCHAGGKRHGFNTFLSTTGTFVGTSGEIVPYEDARHFSVGFASGKASGVAFQDQVCLGHGSARTICANSTKLLLAEWESDDFADFEFDGLLGLAPDGPLSAGPGFSLLDNLVQQGQLSRKMFAFYLQEGSASVLSLGGYDEQWSQRLTWLEVDGGKGSWEVALDDITVNGSKQNLSQCSSFHGQCTAVVDSGCGGIGLPTGMADKLAQQIGFTGENFQCQHPMLALPRIGFVLGGKAFEVSPIDYIEVASSDPNSCHLRFSDTVASNAGPSFLLGHPFLQRHYSVYDQDELRLGLAPLPEPEVPKKGSAEAAMDAMLAQALR